MLGPLSAEFEADDAALLSVPAITAGELSATTVMSRVVPTGYTPGSPDGVLDVTVRNEGLTDIESGYAVMLTLDEAGYPIDFTNFFSTDVVSAGGEAIYSFDSFPFAGRADTVRVIVGYFDPL